MLNKTTLGLTVLLASTGAYAVDDSVDFTGTVSSACTFSNAVNGTLNVSGTSFSSAADGSLQVDVNDPNTYVLSLGATAMTSAPDGQGITSVTPTAVLAGANNILGTLTNIGASTITLGLNSGVLDATATAGSYTITQTVSCL